MAIPRVYRTGLRPRHLRSLARVLHDYRPLPEWLMEPDTITTPEHPVVQEIRDKFKRRGLILRLYDQLRQLRDEGEKIISRLKISQISELS